MTSKDLPFQYEIGRRSNYVGSGKEVQVENIRAYISQPNYGSNKAVILVHDIYGWQFPDTRYITDILASNGYITICPDFFLGKEPWKSNNHWHDFADWLKQRDPMKVDKTTAVIMKFLKEKYNAIKIGIIRDSEDRYELLNPTFFIFGGKDHTISLDQVALLEEKLKEYCRVDYKVKIYPGQVHGFAQCKPEDMKPEDVPFMEEARMDMIDWLNKYIMTAAESAMANEANPCPCNIADKFEYEGLGHEVSVEHIRAYLNKPSHHTDKAVIVIHDIFGWQLPNTRFIADMLASNGYIAICPDFYKGQAPWTPSSDWATFDDWLKTRDSKHINKLVYQFMVTALEQKLKQQCKTEFEVKIYPGQTHGFVHRKREDINPQDKPYIEEARKDMLNWLNRYI
ncbi:hypothetical protein JD844_016926 [Phrynosoma platyrhinos]|uniref:Carboxymethylenebutenolidase homolog n=1 Tax=Phrynosoma platyrhinos TaxID=52577 RepID=A0ABQ7SKY1_PHRPL|nr:hypothetical protein JD844_016926 [Phrynosoma platyrhinos]